MSAKWQSSAPLAAGWEAGSLAYPYSHGAGDSRRETDPALPLPLPPPHFPPNPWNRGEEGKACGNSCGIAEGKRQAGPSKTEGRRAEGGGGSSRVPSPASHQPSTQSREGSPQEISSCPWRTEGRVPATVAKRLPAAAFRWKLVAPRPRAAPPTTAAISAACRLTEARGRREESSLFQSTNGRAA